MLSQHASVKPDKLSQHARYRQAIPACTAKDYCIKGAARAQNSRVAVTAGIAVGVRGVQYKKTSRAGADPATTTLHGAR